MKNINIYIFNPFFFYLLESDLSVDDISTDGASESSLSSASASDEEKEWLQALESGKLDDSGRVLKDKDPALLTARQVSILERLLFQNLIILPYLLSF